MNWGRVLGAALLVSLPILLVARQLPLIVGVITYLNREEEYGIQVDSLYWCKPGNSEVRYLFLSGELKEGDEVLYVRLGLVGIIIKLREAEPPPPPPTKFVVTVAASGPGSTDPAPGAYEVESGEVFTVQAIPDTGKVFKGWVVGEATLTENPLSLEVTADVTVTAEFASDTTVMFLTHVDKAPPPSEVVLEPYLSDPRFVVWPYNYCFTDFPIWGDYFTSKAGYVNIATKLAWWQSHGFKNILYVDITESHISIADRWADSILSTGDWWALMTLNPSKSWYKYLKQGMLNFAQYFGTMMDGFAIDRVDRAATTQEAAWARQLLDEVRAESGRPLEYCMNTLQGWMTSLAGMCSFLGSDGMPYDEPQLTQTLSVYGNLAQQTSSKRFYYNPQMDLAHSTKVYALKNILAKHNFVFFDDYDLQLLEDVLS